MGAQSKQLVNNCPGLSSSRTLSERRSRVEYVREVVGVVVMEGRNKQWQRRQEASFVYWACVGKPKQGSDFARSSTVHDGRKRDRAARLLAGSGSLHQCRWGHCVMAWSIVPPLTCACCSAAGTANMEAHCTLEHSCQHLYARRTTDPHHIVR